MKLVVLGATGGTGVEIVRHALKRGHDVTAFVRSSEGLRQFEDAITIRKGNLLDASEMEGAIRRQDAIVSGFGPRLPIPKEEEDLLSRFAVTLTEAMKASGVRRVVIESTAFLFRDSILPPTHLVGKLFFPRVVADATRMESVFRTSALDWTIVRPPQLTNERCSGKYRVRKDHLPAFGFRISRADVAQFMVTCAEDMNTIKKILGVSH